MHKMRINNIIDNYYIKGQVPMMKIEFGKHNCSNLSSSMIVLRYLQNYYSYAIYISNNNAFDYEEELRELINKFRQFTYAPIIINTTLNTKEISYRYPWLLQYTNINIKYK